MSDMFDVKLLADEILLLDGRCRPEIQAFVDQARDSLELAARGLPISIAKMITEIVAVAEKDGRLVYQQANIKHCPCCGHSEGYWPVKRSTQYKTKGKPDYDKPKMFRAVNVRWSFVSFANHISVGWCDHCANQVLPTLRALLSGVRADIPEAILGAPSHWVWQQNRHCKTCGWTGHEGQMGREMTLMGDGTYPASCPQCGARSGLFSNAVEIADGFTIVERERAKATTP